MFAFRCGANRYEGHLTTDVVRASVGCSFLSDLNSSVLSGRGPWRLWVCNVDPANQSESRGMPAGAMHLIESGLLVQSFAL